eukprot:9700382-Alexandrium_andersonii.AAC.1
MTWIRGSAQGTSAEAMQAARHTSLSRDSNHAPASTQHRHNDNNRSHDDDNNDDNDDNHKSSRVGFATRDHPGSTSGTPVLSADSECART